MSRWLAALCIMLAAGLSQSAHAHETRPAQLRIEQSGPTHFRISWKQPIIGELAVPLKPWLSTGWLDRPPATEDADGTLLMRTWEIDAVAPGELGVAIEGLERTITDTVVTVQLADGHSFETLLKPDRRDATISLDPDRTPPVPVYFRLGVEHIMSGVDHLMFVLGLLVITGIGWNLVKAITAFTIAHTLTLGASTLNLIQAPSATIEALVALSILFLAVELARGSDAPATLARRWPWLIAFLFGLLHGFAFAGAMAELGVPKDAALSALLLFNLGVEAGQLLFASAVVLLLVLGRRLTTDRPSLRRSSERFAAYALGACASYWFIDRTFIAFAGAS